MTPRRRQANATWKPTPNNPTKTAMTLDNPSLAYSDLNYDTVQSLGARVNVRSFNDMIYYHMNCLILYISQPSCLLQLISLGLRMQVYPAATCIDSIEIDQASYRCLCYKDWHGQEPDYSFHCRLLEEARQNSGRCSSSYAI